jgi:hypothetical protein
MNRRHPLRRTGALALAAATALTCATACSKDDESSTATPAAATAGAEPKTVDGAKTAAQTVFDRFAGGDYAGAWDLYTAAGKAAITKVDYVKLNEACSRKGIAIQLSSARLDGTDKAIVIAKQLASAQSYTMIYEKDAWHLAPAPAGLALYKLGAVKAIAAQKKAGTCATS